MVGQGSAVLALDAVSDVLGHGINLLVSVLLSSRCFANTTKMVLNELVNFNTNICEMCF